MDYGVTYEDELTDIRIDTVNAIDAMNCNLIEFWSAHDQAIELVGKLPEGCLHSLKQFNPVWPGMVRETVAKIGDVLKRTRPQSEDTLPQFLNCVDILRSDETTARLKTLQDADGELTRAATNQQSPVVPDGWKRTTCKKLTFALEIDQKTLLGKFDSQEIGNRKISNQSYWINPADLQLTASELVELFKTGKNVGGK